VYLAQDRKHDRHVAIKVLRDDVAASVGRERFLREIQLVATLSHLHILPLDDSGEANGALFFVMPNVQGESLRDRLPGAYVQRGAQSLGEAVYTELQARPQTEHVSRMALAIAASQLGRVDEAIAYAIDSVVSSDNSGPFLTRRPFVSEAFHAHPRYPELLRAIGL